MLNMCNGNFICSHGHKRYTSPTHRALSSLLSSVFYLLLKLFLASVLCSPLFFAAQSDLEIWGGFSARFIFPNRAFTPYKLTRAGLNLSHVLCIFVASLYCTYQWSTKSPGHPRRAPVSPAHADVPHGFDLVMWALLGHEGDPFREGRLSHFKGARLALMSPNGILHIEHCCGMRCTRCPVTRAARFVRVSVHWSQA